MLSDNNAIATVGVKNLEKSKDFYERTGFQPRTLPKSARPTS